MIRLLVAGFAWLGLISFALAQQPQPADPIMLQRVISVLEQQRNAALNGQANSETRALGLSDEIQKLKARVRELEDAKAKSDAAPARAEKE